MACCTETTVWRAGKARVAFMLPGGIEQDHLILLKDHGGRHDSPVVKCALI